jgi:Fe-S-cluster containining protein
MLMKDGHCTCLEGNIGDCRCTIYEARPMSCRDFEPGDGPCTEKRSEFEIMVDVVTK